MPFIVGNFSAWFHGIFLPLTQPTIPAGQGFVDVALFEHMGGGSLRLFNDAGLLVLIGSVVMVWLYYRQLKPLIFLIPSLVLFWTLRSFSSYLLDLLPFALLAAMTIEPATNYLAIPRWRRPIVFALSGGFLTLLLSIMFLTPSPLAISVQDVSVNRHKTINQITIDVTNKTKQEMHLYFTLTTAGRATSFWIASASVLMPNQTRQVSLFPPNTASMPYLDSDFIIDAFTTHPATLSTSALCRGWKMKVSRGVDNSPKSE
jgi:hypothetical protein